MLSEPHLTKLDKDREPHLTELDNYIDICITVAKAIRWLTFAVSLCSGSLLLLLATYYYGNFRYAVERRKAIQEQCFESTIKPENTKPCYQFAKDTWDKELKFLPTPSPTPTLSPTSSPTPSPSLSSSSEEIFNAHKQELEAYNKEQIKSFYRAGSETHIIQLPLINIKVLNTDFAPILVLLGLFFLYWLRLNLEFARNTLCGLYNEISSAYQATRTVPAHFILLWPGGSRRRSHWIFWAVLYSLIASGLLLIFSDYYDSFITGTHQIYSVSEQAGWLKGSGGEWLSYRTYAWGKIFFELGLIGAAAYIIWRSHSIVRDVRNLLMLIEWDSKAFQPLLRRLFNKNKPMLLDGANETAYDEYDNGLFCLRMRFNFSKGDNNQTAADSEKWFYTRINLWTSASDRRSYAPSVERSEIFDDGEWEHSSSEERRMRYFFFNILSNPDIERELCYGFWSIAKEKLEKKEGNWIDRCRKEFAEKESLPRKPVDPRIKAKEICEK